jgi:phosphoribosylformylglycinamidine cyclo-ligase
MEPDAYDLAATAVGVVEADGLLGPDRVAAGDAVVALGSSGLHSNGYSLVRRVIRGRSLAEHVPELGRTLGEELLEPTRIYAKDCLALAAATEVHAYAHVTGGGLAGNLAGCCRRRWTRSSTGRPGPDRPVFDLVARLGPVAPAEIERTLNIGVGMVAVLPDGAAAVRLLADRGVPAWVAGEIAPGSGRALLVGTHPD